MDCWMWEPFLPVHGTVDVASALGIHSVLDSSFCAVAFCI